ncbi:hypothetical protein ANCDUO_17573 [Ancylostoma duodenale]|uniref:Myosin VII N-terminal domain-containing protein n=1 Tax=Ancylostoma duodenale TaxID=51022 RepID=A0A0C2G5I8_9BILA|nr:hypothetical protein ANCDUO_17573 [Ancylostoma duodenale]
MVLVSKGDFIWIEPLAGEGIPVGARVLDQDHGRLKVVDDLGQENELTMGDNTRKARCAFEVRKNSPKTHERFRVLLGQMHLAKGQVVTMSSKIRQWGGDVQQ